MLRPSLVVEKKTFNPLALCRLARKPPSNLYVGYITSNTQANSSLAGVNSQTEVQPTLAMISSRYKNNYMLALWFSLCDV